ncbi:hypothetical protein D3C73_837460 [compost metagenome]
MQDDRQSIDGDDLFGGGAFQVAQWLEADQLAVLDRPGRGSEIGTGAFQRGEAGTRAVGRQLHFDPTAFQGFTDDTRFVGLVRRFAVHLEQTLLAHQTFDQRRPQCRANGVGALDAQHRTLPGDRQGAGRCRQRQPGAQHQQEQPAQRHAGTFEDQWKCRENKSERCPKDDNPVCRPRFCRRQLASEDARKTSASLKDTIAD